MKLFPIKKILILVTILAVPGFLYYLLQDQGKNRYKPLPIMGPKQVGSTFHTKRGVEIPDTIFHQAADFNLVNQSGKAVNWSSYNNKVTLIYLFYIKASNPAVDFTNKAVQALQHSYAGNERVQFIGLSLDPKNDTPQLLSAYANSLSAVEGKWDLLTGDSSQLYPFINKQLFVDAISEKGNGGADKFTYSNMIVLLDTQHRIRGYYEASNQEALARLDDEIKVLIAEELRNNTDGR
jgi:protein SCO1/2